MRNREGQDWPSFFNLRAHPVAEDKRVWVERRVDILLDDGGPPTFVQAKTTRPEGWRGRPGRVEGLHHSMPEGQVGSGLTAELRAGEPHRQHPGLMTATPTAPVKGYHQKAVPLELLAQRLSHTFQEEVEDVHLELHGKLSVQLAVGILGEFRDLRRVDLQADIHKRPAFVFVGRLSKERGHAEVVQPHHLCEEQVLVAG
mmetsp:Transcript_73149/g.171525  ORF Transcript_73149/g.171525 Transcript_73149/m.171525 type:complete len:200 (-) Transcript_73149:268-867(-)